MSVQYAPQKLKVPDGFNNLLEGLAREVLREQPENIIKFAADYFKKQTVLGGEIDEQPASMEPKQMETVVADEADPPPPRQPVTPPVAMDDGEKREETPSAYDENEAATKIQAIVRGKKARDEVNALKAEKKGETATKKENENTSEPEKETCETDDNNPDEDDTEELAAAAVKIQASFRGMKARKQLESSKEQINDTEEENRPAVEEE